MSRILKAIFAVGMVMVALCNAPQAKAQRIALKTNTIDWVALSPNMTLEARLSRRVSLQVGLAANPFTFEVFNTNWKSFRVEPELRYWFNRPMARHFIALSGTAAEFNFHHNSHYFMGDAVAAGLSYGYALVLGRHWNMEVEAGVGMAHVSAYDYHEVKPESKNHSQWHVVPMRVGLSFAYVFK
jgi:hypothetical protein